MTNLFRSTSAHRPWAVLTAVCLAALALPLSFSGGALATPEIGREFGGSAAAMSWITNAFMLTFGSLLMAAGTLADRYGRKRVFALGVATFTLCSLLIGAAPSLLVLDLLRAAQGIAAAAALAGGTAALAQEFDGAARARAFSLLGTTFGLGLALGPLLAGVLIDRIGWRAVFATGALAGLVALRVGVPHMRESRDPDAGTIDWAGIGTFTGALSCFTWGMIVAAQRGDTSPLVGILFASAGCLGAAFWRVETRTARPMLDLTLFRYPAFVGVQLLPVATCCSYVVLLVLLPARLVGIDGVGVVQTGLLMVALSAPMLVVPMVAAMLTRWWSPGILCGTGLAIAAAGLYWLRAALDAGSHPGAGGVLIGPLLTIGAGAGIPWGLMDGLAIGVVPTERAGMAAGVFGTARVAGEGIALATVNALLALGMHAGIVVAMRGAVSPAAAWEAAARLAAGDLAGTEARLGPAYRPALVHIHADAFGSLLTGLALTSLACAGLVVLALVPRETLNQACAGSHPPPS